MGNHPEKLDANFNCKLATIASQILKPSALYKLSKPEIAFELYMYTSHHISLQSSI